MPIQYQLAPPKNWQDFETLARDLWRAIWRDPDTKKNGRSGQAQHGVDVYGRPGEKWSGVQCKGKELYPPQELTEAEVLEEIEKAKRFEPKLSHWILATTAQKNARLEKLARELTDQHVKKGLFTVSIWFWADIREELSTRPEILKQYYSNSFVDDERIDRILENTDKLISIHESETNTTPSNLKGTPDASSLVLGIQELAIADEHQAAIEYSRDLLNSYQPRQAVEYLKKLKNRIWQKSSDRTKYLLLANLAFAYYKGGDFQPAAVNFSEASKFGEKSEHSLANLALAHQSIGKFDDAERYALEAIKKGAENVNAHIVLLNLPKNRKSLKKAQNLIPPILKTDAGIAHNLAWIAFENGEMESAIQWAETSVEGDGQNNPELLATLGQFLIPRKAGGDEGGQNQERLRRSIDLLTRAWQKIRGTDFEKQHSNWILNRGVAYRMLGQFQEAIVDVDAALKIQPDRAEYIRHRALIEMVKGTYNDAVPSLISIRDNPETPDAVLLLADAFGFEGHFQDAVRNLSEHLERFPDSENSNVVAGLLITLCTHLKDTDKAEELLLKYFPVSDRSFRAVVNRSRVERGKGREAQANSLLDEAKSKVNATTSQAEILDLAFEYYDAKDFVNAADCFALRADALENNRVSRLLLRCRYLAGQLSNALEVCQALRTKFGVTADVIDIEIAIREETGDLKTAKELCEQKLAAFPDELFTKIRLAWFSYRLRDYDEVDKFLSEEFDPDLIDLDLAPKLMHLLAARDQVKRGIQLMYELRKKYGNRPEAHFFYVSAFFEYKRQDDDWLACETVRVPCAVLLADESGKTRWYEIVDNDDEEDLKSFKFSARHALVKRLLGKKVDDTVSLTIANELVGRIETIKEIKSTYLYALHETMDNYERMFPESGSLKQIFVGDPEKKDEFARHSQKFFELVTKQQERMASIHDLYRERKLTIGGFAGLSGKTSVEAWLFLINNSHVPAWVSTGTVEESDEALEALNPCPRLVVDFTSLLLIYDLQLGEVLTQHFGKFLIAQATVTLLQDYILELKAKRGGYHTVGSVGGQFHVSDFSPEFVSNQLVTFEQVLEWVDVNCEISAYRTGLDIPRHDKDAVKDALKPEFFDTLQIIADEKYFLVSEDLIFRAVARNEYSMKGSCLQSLLLYLLDRQFIGTQVYNQSTVRLASLSTEFVRVTSGSLLLGAVKSQWRLVPPLNRLLSRLGSKESDLSSTVQVAVEFAYFVCKVSLPTRLKKSILISILVSISVNQKNVNELANLFLWISRFQITKEPAILEFIVKTVIEWNETRRIIPFCIPQG